MMAKLQKLLWITDVLDLPVWENPVSLTIGNFDGVHLGHQALLEKVVRWKSEAIPVVLTFHPHPLQILHPEKRHTRLFDFEDQKERLSAAKVQVVCQYPFSRDFSEISAQDFLQKFLKKYFRPAHLVVGHDFSFGAGREGSRDLLQEFCQKEKIELEFLPPFKVKNEIASTTEIRKALLSGEPSKAKDLLGRAYFLRGYVVKGERRGKLLGYPTANLKPSVDFIPKVGVYVVRVLIEGEWKKGVTNIGINKTFVEGDQHPVKVETYIFDFSKEIYGQEIKIELIDFLRDEQKFSNLEALKLQIGKDVKKAQEVLS